VDKGQQRAQPVGSSLLHARPLQAQALQILHDSSHTAASFHLLLVPYMRLAMGQVWLLHMRWSLPLSSNSNGPWALSSVGKRADGQGAGGMWSALALCPATSQARNAAVYWVQPPTAAAGEGRTHGEVAEGQDAIGGELCAGQIQLAQPREALEYEHRLVGDSSILGERQSSQPRQPHQLLGTLVADAAAADFQPLQLPERPARCDHIDYQIR